MNKVLVITILIVLLAIGIYFVFSNYNLKPINKNNIANSKDTIGHCTIGDSRYTPIPDGQTASGKITGIETYTFRNGEKLALCCNDASNLAGDLNYKDCTGTDKNNPNVITHEILWKKIGNNLVKLKEVEPENSGTCTYYYNSAGEVESRMCS